MVPAPPPPLSFPPKNIDQTIKQSYPIEAETSLSFVLAGCFRVLVCFSTLTHFFSVWFILPRSYSLLLLVVKRLFSIFCAVVLFLDSFVDFTCEMSGIPRPELVIAIDFGMTCTGVAFANISTGEETVRWLQKWPGRSNAVENKVYFARNFHFTFYSSRVFKC